LNLDFPASARFELSCMLLATAGSGAVTQEFFPGRSEQIFYGSFLVPIASFHLAFVA
jgi:hypothetical protein